MQLRMPNFSWGGEGMGKRSCSLTAFTLCREKGTYWNVFIQIHQLLAGYWNQSAEPVTSIWDLIDVLVVSASCQGEVFIVYGCHFSWRLDMRPIKFEALLSYCRHKIWNVLWTKILHRRKWFLFTFYSPDCFSFYSLICILSNRKFAFRAVPGKPYCIQGSIRFLFLQRYKIL